MAAVAPGDVLSADNPILDAFSAADGVLVDPFALSFQVFDVHDEDAVAVQVYPATAGTKHAVDLVVDKIGLGHFAAAWTVPGSPELGRYEIRWYLTVVEGGPELTWRRDFEVLAVVPHGGIDGYALIADVREEGVPADTKNRRIAEAIARASTLIRAWTGRDFNPTYKTVKVAGFRGGLLMLDEAIAAVDGLTYEGETSPLDPTVYRVFARHLTEGLLSPDDRDSPKIARAAGAWRSSTDPYTFPLVGSLADLRSPRVPHGQEITVAGVFGYTDPEPRGSPVGVTPAPIRRATVLLALRDLPKLVSQPADAFDAKNAHLVRSQRTREQSIEWATSSPSGTSAAGYAPFTGDPAIDSILLTYVKTFSGSAV